MRAGILRAAPAARWAVLPLPVLALLALAALLLVPEGGGPLAGTRQAAHPLTFYDARAFSLALEETGRTPVAPMPGARAVVVPHHWLAGHLILSGLRDLAASGAYDRVLLIGPDHVGAASAGAATSDLPWETPFGLLQADAESVSRLAAAGVARVEPDTLSDEHSVAGIVPAIAYYLPGAEVVPLILRGDLDSGQVSALARALVPLLDDGTVIVASVDFSHYLSAPEARARNAETLAAMEAMDSQRILAFGDEHLDSPPTIALVSELARQRGGGFHLRANTNSGELNGLFRPPVTSYITGYYR